MSCLRWEVQILRWQKGELDRQAEALLLKHLENCINCRSLAEKFSDVDKLLMQSTESSLPPFLKERIVSAIAEEMRQDSTRGAVSHFFDFLVSLRPAVAGAVLVLGVLLGVATGWSLAKSVLRDTNASSYDLLSLAQFGGAESGSSLEFLWTDSNERTGR